MLHILKHTLVDHVTLNLIKHATPVIACSPSLRVSSQWKYPIKTHQFKSHNKFHIIIKTHRLVSLLQMFITPKQKYESILKNVKLKQSKRSLVLHIRA